MIPGSAPSSCGGAGRTIGHENGEHDDVEKTTEERYNAELDHMIPTAMTDCGFLVGEPDDHNAERQPRYGAFVKINGEFFESTAPITINEFNSLKISDVKTRRLTAS